MAYIKMVLTDQIENQSMNKCSEMTPSIRLFFSNFSTGHEVDASEELYLPMANDAAGQASTSSRIVESLDNRVQTFLSIDAALPEEVRRKTKKLADLLSELFPDDLGRLPCKCPFFGAPCETMTDIMVTLSSNPTSFP